MSESSPPPEAGERLDRYLARAAGAPRNQVRRWIEEGKVDVGGRPVTKVSQPLFPGDVVRWQTPSPRGEDRVVPEAGPLDLLYEDRHLLVLAKPAGLVVHPGAGHNHGTLVHRLLARYPELAGVGGPGRPGIVHRLDAGTSGVMVVARSAEAYQALSRAFAARRVVKTYLAIVYGRPDPPAGSIEAPIGRHPQRRQEMAVVPRGRPASTRYRTLATAAGVSLLEIDLATGRTHQIRVHLKSIGHPLVGDPTYGERRYKGLPGPGQRSLAQFPRPALHAWRLGFDHPVTGERREFSATPPADLATLWGEVAGQAWPTQLRSSESGR